MTRASAEKLISDSLLALCAAALQTPCGEDNARICPCRHVKCWQGDGFGFQIYF
jgi:hypothetical protein